MSAPGRGLGKGMWALVWLLALGLGTYWFGLWEANRANPNSAPHSVQGADAVEVTLQRNSQHHFVATGFINGQRIEFLVDTGATDVSISAAVAERLGLSPGALVVVNTANGQSRAYRTLLDTLSIGAITLVDVRALIVPGMHDDQVLLGMSALKELEFTQRSGTLLLRQYR